VNNPLAFIRANLSQLEKLAHELSDRASRRYSPRPCARCSTTRWSWSEKRKKVSSASRRWWRASSRSRATIRTIRTSHAVDLARVADAAVAMASVGMPPGRSGASAARCRWRGAWKATWSRSR